MERSETLLSSFFFFFLQGVGSAASFYSVVLTAASWYVFKIGQELRDLPATLYWGMTLEDMCHHTQPGVKYFKSIYDKETSQVVMTHTVNSRFELQISEFNASLVNRVSSRTAKANEKCPASEEKQKQSTNK